MLTQTQYFDASKTKPKHAGRYKFKYNNEKRPVMRWWNGKNWQYNRRKAITFSPIPGDAWAGAVELHPEVEKMLSLGLASSDFQPVKLDLALRASKPSKVHRLEDRLSH